MNKKIVDMLAQVGAHEIHDSRGFQNRYHYAMTSDSVDKFVQAIVRECGYVGMVLTDDHFDVQALYKHFGIEE
jgi:hypothetical protein